MFLKSNQPATIYTKAVQPYCRINFIISFNTGSLHDTIVLEMLTCHLNYWEEVKWVLKNLAMYEKIQQEIIEKIIHWEVTFPPNSFPRFNSFFLRVMTAPGKPV